MESKDSEKSIAKLDVSENENKAKPIEKKIKKEKNITYLNLYCC